MFNRNMMRQTPFMGVMPNQDGFIDIDNNSGNIDIDLNQAQATNANQFQGGGANAQSPVIEPMRERVVNRTIEHVVPHV